MSIAGNSSENFRHITQNNRLKMLLKVVLVRVSAAVKTHHDHGNSYKGKHFIVVAHLQSSGSVHYHHCGT